LTTLFHRSQGQVIINKQALTPFHRKLRMVLKINPEKAMALLIAFFRFLNNPAAEPL
jgi:hypothetical protein